MASPENLATKPRTRKPRTLRLLPEVDDFFSSQPGTLNTVVNGFGLSLARQARAGGVDVPRSILDFLVAVRADCEIPPEFRHTAREREHMRVQQAKYVGLPKKPEVIEALQVEQLPEVIEALQVEQLPDVAPKKETVCQSFSKQGKPSRLFGNVQTPINPPAHPEELEKRSETLSALVRVAAVLCPTSLSIVRLEATPETPTIALEARLTGFVEFYQPQPQTPFKTRLKRDLS